MMSFLNGREGCCPPPGWDGKGSVPAICYPCPPETRSPSEILALIRKLEEELENLPMEREERWARERKIEELVDQLPKGSGSKPHPMKPTGGEVLYMLAAGGVILWLLS